MKGALVLSLAALALIGCAGRSATRIPPGVPVDSRPTPPPPDSALADTVDSVRPGATAPNHAAPAQPPSTSPGTAPPEAPPPVASVISPDERRQTLARIVADTTAAGGAVRRCAGRKLLPDQESVFDTARSLLGQARAALEQDELWRAESLARKARQLASSLNCPG
jgi:hypothetical protein